MKPEQERAAPSKDGKARDEFAAIVGRFETPLLRFVARKLNPDSHAAEDVVQEVFLRLHRGMQSGRKVDSSRLNAWLFRTARNASIDEIRKRRRTQGLFEKLLRHGEATAEDEPRDGAASLIKKEAREKAVEHFKNLPPEQRELLDLRVMEGLTLREIGEITGLSPGNVDYRINTGLRKLAASLKAAGVV